jgi:hypothetical protein
MFFAVHVLVLDVIIKSQSMHLLQASKNSFSTSVDIALNFFFTRAKSI